MLDAGNSPAQLARQCVRYLRNALIAKIAGLSPEGAAAEGIGSELLQISPDEQRRAARTAALFSEEELTRFLQVMLRTFDELGYRQEQRFHFELGLLKLVHLRRLLPSKKSSASQPLRHSHPSPAPPAASSSAGLASRDGVGRLLRRASSPSPDPVRPAFSPFEQDRSAAIPSHPPARPSMSLRSPPHPITEIRGATAVSVAPAPRPALEAVPHQADHLAAAPALGDAAHPRSSLRPTLNAPSSRPSPPPTYPPPPTPWPTPLDHRRRRSIHSNRAL